MRRWAWLLLLYSVGTVLVAWLTHTWLRREGFQEGGTQEQEIDAIMQPANEDIFQIEIPRPFAVWARQQNRSMSPRAIRSKILNNYTAEYTAFMGADSTTAVDHAAACKEITNAIVQFNTDLAKPEIQGEIQKIADTAKDFVDARTKNYVAQTSRHIGGKCKRVTIKTPTGDIPAGELKGHPCNLLAEQDDLIVDNIPYYEAVNNSVLEGEFYVQTAEPAEYRIQNQLADLRNMMQCPNDTNISLDAKVVQGSQTAEGKSYGKLDLNLEYLGQKLAQMSPLYLSPKVTTYLSSYLANIDEIEKTISSVNDALSNIRRTTGRVNRLLGIGPTGPTGPSGAR